MWTTIRSRPRSSDYPHVYSHPFRERLSQPGVRVGVLKWSHNVRTVTLLLDRTIHNGDCRQWRLPLIVSPPPADGLGDCVSVTLPSHVACAASARVGGGMIELQCSPRLALRASCVDSLAPSIFLGRNGVRLSDSLSRSNKHSDSLRDSRRRDGALVIARMAAGAKTPGSISAHTSIRKPHDQFFGMYSFIKTFTRCFQSETTIIFSKLSLGIRDIRD